MVTVIEEYITEEQRYVMLFFFVGKGISAKNIHNKMFPVYVGKCLSRKAVPSCWQTFRLMTERLKRKCGSDLDDT
jgi:hypothetical protein